MDRNKPGPGRPGKSKLGVPPHGSELYALGSKSTGGASGRGGGDDGNAKSKVMSGASAAGKSMGGSSGAGSGSSSDHHRKRDAGSSSIGGMTVKKSKSSGDAMRSGASAGAGASGAGGSAGSSRMAVDSVLMGAVGSGRESSHNAGYGSGGSGSGGGGGGGGNGGNSSGSAHSLENWEQVALECDPVELVGSVLAAIEQQDNDTVVALVCGAIRSVIYPRAKPDQLLSLSLLYLARVRASIFSNDTVTAALLSILRRDAATVSHVPFKGRPNPSNHVLAANLLARGYHNRSAWPERFVRVYMDDAINERVWVDLEECASFVDNICTAFGTRVPSKAMLSSDVLSGATGSASTQSAAAAALAAAAAASREQFNAASMDDDSADTMSDTARTGGTATTSADSADICPTQQRYAHLQAEVERMVADTVRDLLNRRQAPDSSTRNLLRFLSAAAGLVEVRALASHGGRLEHWLHNGKLMKPAQELLTYLCCNVTGAEGQRDHEVLASLVKMRLKTKPLINIYMQCLREMVTLQPNVLSVVMKLVVQNELAAVRNPNNMGMLASMFQTKPDEAAQHFAEIYQEFLQQREDCLRTLRVFLRELVKQLRYDMKLPVFAATLLQHTPALQQLCDKADYKDRVAFAMMDLVCLCMFLCVTPQVKEAQAAVRAGREVARGGGVLAEFYEQVTQIQLCALRWTVDVLPFAFKLGEAEFAPFVQKVLFMDAAENYSKVDAWPPDQERNALVRMVADVPLTQPALGYILALGARKEVPFKSGETVDLAETVMRRAAGLRLVDYAVLPIEDTQMIDEMLNLSVYHHPPHIVLPQGYDPPRLAIIAQYWKVLQMLLMMSAHNPGTIGAYCWAQFPVMKMLLEMCITNQFADVRPCDDELQLLALERTQILEFEMHLAAATSKIVINEQTSLLLPQVVLMNPYGAPRRIQQHQLDQCQQLNATHKLGHLLCRSRRPDLLLDIIQRQGSSQSMPWLADLVQNSDGDFNHLPVQCLCEFLLSNATALSAGSEKQRDIELLAYLQKLLMDDLGEPQATVEVLEYFMRRLSSTSKQSRQMAIVGLRLLLRVFANRDEDMETGLVYAEQDSDWLLRHLPMIPYFLTVRSSVIVQLRAACQIENNPDLVMVFIQFIAANTQCDGVPEMLEHVMDMSQLIVERSTVFTAIVPAWTDDGEVTDDCRMQTLNCLFVMYNNYLIKLKELKAPFEWTEYPDILMVHFTDGTQIPIHMNIIQAFVILLTYSLIISNSQPILDYWFPPNAPPPLAYNLDDPNEPIQILPDWLKLKMIRSPVERLVDAALLDLTPDQIVLFVQNFGTPINSMSKLLALLDRCVIEQFDNLKQAILNKAYLAQLIEIQQQRGAKNGHIAVEALDLHAKVQPDPSQRSTACLGDVSAAVDAAAAREPFLPSRSKEIDEVVELVLGKRPPFDRVASQRIRRVMQQLIGRDQVSGGGVRPMGARLKQSFGTADQMQTFTATRVLQYLQRIVQSSRGPFVLQALHQSPAVCSLFRALMTWQPQQPEMQVFMVQVVDACMQHISAKTAPQLVQIVQKKRVALVKAAAKQTATATAAVATPAVDVLKKEPEEPADAEVQAPAADAQLRLVLATANNTELESRGKRAIAQLAHHNADTAPLIRCITDELTANGARRSERIGLLIDWLANLDSELVSGSGDADGQMQLLFAQSPHQFRYYLLALLSHQASWSTLAACMARLLARYRSDYDAAAVLHFVEALCGNPKLWQGREKATPKHEQIEYVLQMSPAQIEVFADYALSEPEPPAAAAAAGGSSAQRQLSERVRALLRCVRPEAFNVRRLVAYVRAHPRAPRERRRQFLQQLYLNVPPMKYAACDDDDDVDAAALVVGVRDTLRIEDVLRSDAKQLIGCQLDVIANYTLTALASMTAAREFAAPAAEMELHVRKLAATHPALLLRHLAVLAALLQGRAHMDWQAVRHKSLRLFHQVLGLLELLQPLVFADAYRDALHSALDCYFTLLRHHGQKDFRLLCRFMDLLQAYTTSNANRALMYVEQYAELMQQISARNRGVPALQQMVQGISLLKHRHAHDFRNLTPDQQEEAAATEVQPTVTTAAAATSSTSTMTTTTSTATAATATATPSTAAASTSTAAVAATAAAAPMAGEADSTGAAAVILAPYMNSQQPAHWAKMLGAALTLSGAELLAPLQEIEAATEKRQGLLEPLFERLLELLDSTYVGVRQVAHVLLVRHLRHQPGDAAVNGKALAGYVRCLRDADAMVVQSALGTLTEMVICLQENAAEILQLVFDLGVRSKVNTSEPLRKCVQALKAQHAC